MSASSAEPAGSHLIVLYDGVCGLCNRLVQFILKRDRRDQFQYASLQSPFARAALARLSIASADLNTVYVVAGYGGPGERVFRKSAALGEIAVRLGGIWKLGAILRMVPRPLADAAYDLIARHRYEIFGKYETCPLPSPGERGKFLDSEEATPQAAAAVDVASELARMCGEAHAYKDPRVLQACAIDGVVPQAVVEPGSPDEVAAILRFARASRLAVVPAGGFTRQHTGDRAQAVDIVLRTSRLNGIEIRGDATIRVDAGAALRDIETRLAEQNQFIPAEPDEEGTIGGALAVAAESPLRHGYGSLRECCTGMTFVTGNGEICTVPGGIPIELAGFDLMKLMAGSYGSLGVIVNASLKVFPRAVQTRTLVAKFLLASGAAQFRDRVLRSALRPMCLELASPRASEFLDRPERTWSLYLRVAGDDDALAGYRADLGGETYVKEELEGQSESRVWQAFSAFDRLVITRHANAMIVHFSVSVEDAGQAIHAAEKIATANNFLCAQIGRVGVGALVMAFIPLGAPITTNYSNTVSALRETVAAGSSSIVVRCPVEVKALLEVWGLTQAEVEAVHKAKRIMDPSGVLNPGRFVI